MLIDHTKNEPLAQSAGKGNQILVNIPSIAQGAADSTRMATTLVYVLMA
jgi:hypothetical protein